MGWPTPTLLGCFENNSISKVHKVVAVILPHVAQHSPWSRYSLPREKPQHAQLSHRDTHPSPATYASLQPPRQGLCLLSLLVLLLPVPCLLHWLLSVKYHVIRHVLGQCLSFHSGLCSSPVVSFLGQDLSSNSAKQPPPSPSQVPGSEQPLRKCLLEEFIPNETLFY